MKLSPSQSYVIGTILCWSFISVCFSCFTSSQTDCEDYDNPYDLEIVYCPSDYFKQIESHQEMELVDLEEIILGIQLDIRYATPRNFTGEVIYTAPKAYLRKPVALALKMVQDSLKGLNLGLVIYDAYRPYAATLKFYEVYPDTNFVAWPGFGSRHNRGCAVDISLIDLTTKKELPMPTPFDEFSEKAHPSFMDLPKEAIQNRQMLFDIMAHFNFTHYPTEWWHFDYQGWEQYPLMDLPFESLSSHSERP